MAPEHVNVGDQRRDHGSLLNFMTLLIRRYRQSPELGWSEFELLDQPQVDVLARRCTWDDGSMVALHNLGPQRHTVSVTLDDCGDSCEPVDLLEDGRTPLDGGGAAVMSPEGYGYRWLRIARSDDRRVHGRNDARAPGPRDALNGRFGTRAWRWPPWAAGRSPWPEACVHGTGVRAGGYRPFSRL